MAKKMRSSPMDRGFGIICYSIVVLFSLIVLLPFWTLIMDAFSSDIGNMGARFWIKKFTLDAWHDVFSQKNLGYYYANTVFVTVVGTLFTVTTTYLAAYPLSKPNMPFNRTITFLMLITMYFSGGLIPMYIVCKTLGLLNTRWILILFGSFSVYNIILIRTNFQSGLPEEMREAAAIDGCSNSRFFFQFALPLSKAIIAVISLYVAVGYWNNYYNALVYVTDRDKQPLQLYLKQLLTVSIGNEANGEADETALINQLSQIVRYAVIVLSTIPIMCMYPFLQKYFVQGVMIGSLKG